MSSIPEDITNAPPEVLAVLASTPAVHPPGGIVPNFFNPRTQAPMQVIVTSIGLGLMLVFFLNRIYTKLWLMRKLSWDDATILFAALGSVAYYVACFWAAQKGGVGKHLWDISIIQAMELDLIIPLWITSVLTNPVFFFLKSTFFILYLSLFRQLRWARLCSWFGLVVTALVHGTLTIISFVFATPRKHESWFAHQSSSAEKKLISIPIPLSIFGLAIDLYILLIPIIGIYGLTMSWKRKIGMILIFLSGIMACACSACSLYYRVILSNTEDLTYILTPMNISSLCEMFAGVICACMPSAAYAVRQKDSVYQKILTSVASSKRRTTPKSGLSLSRSVVIEIHQPPHALKSTDRKYAHYLNMDQVTVT